MSSLPAIHTRGCLRTRRLRPLLHWTSCNRHRTHHGCNRWYHCLHRLLRCDVSLHHHRPPRPITTTPSPDIMVPPLTTDIVLDSLANLSAHPIIQCPRCPQYIHVGACVLADCAHSSNGLAANGVELLTVVTGGTTAFTVSSAAMFRCITTGIPVPFQPLHLPLFWYPNFATKPRPHVDICELPPPLYLVILT